MAIGFGIASRNWWRAQIKGGVSPSFSLDFAKIATDFTFTRSSFATRVNELGLIETVTDLGSELVTNGSFDTDSDWSLTNGATISNGQLNIDYNLGNGYTTQTNVFTIGKTYKIEINVDNSSVGAVRIDNGVSSTVLSNGLNTFYLEAVGTAIEIRNHVNFVGSIDNVSVKEVLEDDVPRIDYSTGEAAFLLEPQSTNLIPYSEDIEGSNWSTSSLATTINVTTSPDGTQNADLIQAIGSSSCFIKDSTLTFTVGNTYTFSIFAKKGNNDWIRTAHFSSATSGSWFDLENGVVGTVNGVSGTIEDFGNGWYKCTNTFVAIQATASNQVFIGISDADGSVNSGADGQNNYVWGAQLEELPYATSYIPTNGTTVTRSAESCVDATPTINSEEGTLYAEISALADDGGFRLLSLNDGTSANIIQMYYSNTSNRITAELKVGNSAQTALRHTVSDVTDFHKVAFKYKQNDFALWIDGVEVDTDNVGSVFAEGTLTELDFNVGTRVFPFYGNTKDLKIYDKALTDDELIELTSI